MTDREKINRGELAMSDADFKYIVSVYDATLNYADYEVGLIEQKLKQLGLWDKTMVFIIADHGEALWEHQYFGHNVQTYQNMAHIPFIVHPPAGGAISGGRTIDSLVETVDIFTTTADVLRSDLGQSKAQGRSLLGLLADPAATRPGLVYTRTLWLKPTYSVRDGTWEYSHSFRFGELELYDLRSDPAEQKNLYSSHPITAAYFEQSLQQWIKAQRAKVREAGAPETAQMDEATRQNLISLGYIDAKTGLPTTPHDSQ
jgi:arylsulfatase A-like enzyme